MSNIELHKNDVLDVELRTFMREGRPVVSAEDLSKALGYSQTQAMLKILRDHHIVEVSRKDLGLAPGRAIRYITEAGLYKAIMSSTMPRAEEFQDWVTDELLPSVRRDGYYISSAITQEQFDQLKSELEGVDHVNGLLSGDYHNEMIKNKILTSENKRLRWRYTLATGEQLN